MIELVTFLNARLDEAERVERRTWKIVEDVVCPACGIERSHTLSTLRPEIRFACGHEITGHEFNSLFCESAADQHALLDIEAKRRMLDYLTDLEDQARNANWWSLDTDLPFKILALPYAEHPDYLEEWRP